MAQNFMKSRSCDGLAAKGLLKRGKGTEKMSLALDLLKTVTLSTFLLCKKWGEGKDI